MPHAGAIGLTTVEINPSSPGAAATGTGVDMQGFDRVVFHVAIGVIGNGATIDARVVGSANANFSGAVNIANAAIVQVLNTSPNVAATIDVYRPTNRYVRLVVTPATNNANVSAVAVRYRGTGNLPPTQPTNYQYVAVSEN
jgi:hypothetical protein